MGKVKEEKKVQLSEVREFYIKNNSGKIFHVHGHKNDNDLVFLRYKNKYIRKPLLEVKQGLVNGTYKHINEHELKRFKAEDETFVKDLSMKMFKRIVLCQLLMELDDELIPLNEDNKYVRGLLERSNKAIERLAAEQYNNLYDHDKDLLINIMNQVDLFTSNAAKMTFEDFPAFNQVFDMYRSNPEQFDIKTFTFKRQV